MMFQQAAVWIQQKSAQAAVLTLQKCRSIKSKQHQYISTPPLNHIFPNNQKNVVLINTKGDFK